MSTTDTRAAFEAWAIKENYAFYSESERCVLFYGVSGTRNAIQKAWDAGMAQAATEAAKATGTAGEQCTCPSGDGSLRWPCPQHPPLPVAITDKTGPNGIKWYVEPNLPDGVNLYIKEQK